jgi:hypothetical protein
MKRILYFLISGALLALNTTTFSQAITGVIVPQIMADTTRGTGENARTPYIIRAKITGLTPNATYRYITRAICLSYNAGANSDNATSTGAGNQIWCRTAGNFGYTSSTGLSTAGGYDTLITNSAGEYEGWFGIEPTANARFAPGNYIHVRIVTNNGTSGNTTQTNYLTVTDSTRTTTYGTGASQGTGIWGHSAAADRNIAVLYDNTAGTGRPLSCAIIENDGIAYRNAGTPTNYPLFYRNNVDTISGAWGTIIPNNLANGVRRIENRKLSDGTLFFANTSSNGVWPTGSVNTVNPSGGYSAIRIDSSDAPLVPPTPKLQFKAVSYTVAENVSTVNVIVKYTAPAATNTTVNVSLGLSSTATAGSDFTFTNPTTLTFTPTDTEKTAVITIIDDAVTESQENIVLRLKNATNSAILINDSATITINDDDGVLVSLASAKQTVSEGAGLLNVVTMLSKPATIASNVTISAVAGTAGTSDYTFASATLNFAIGDSVKTSIITINDDALIEGTEFFTIQLSAPSNASLGTAVDSIFIADNDYPRYPIGQITTVNPSTFIPDSLGKKYDEVGIVYGINYRPAGLQFVIRDNTGGITVFKTLGNHGYSVKEGDSVRVIGTVAQFSGLTEFNSDTVILLGTNKAIKSPVVTTFLGEVHENDLVRFNNVQFITPITVWPSIATNISVRNATDTIVIRVQPANTDIVGKPAPIGSFDIIGLGNQFDGSVPFNSGYQLLPRYLSDIITKPVIFADTTALTVGENAGTVSIKFKIAQVNGQASSAMITLAGSATSGVDYTLASPLVSFPATASNGDSVMVNINIIDDAIQESSETIVLGYNTASNSSVIGSGKVITITDNDAPAKATVKIDSSSIKVNENAGTVSIKARLLSINGIATTINLAFSGTASAGSDYTAPSASITFPANAAVGDSIMINYTIIDDALSEGDETIITTYSAGANAIISGGSTQTITINKNDGFGFDKNEKAEIVKITPNPSNGSITIHSSEKIISMNLYDLNGRLVMKVNAPDNTNQIDGIAPGIYQVVTETSAGLYMQKIAVK